jgi:hypothetical protein
LKKEKERNDGKKGGRPPKIILGRKRGTIGRKYIIDGGQAALEWIWEGNGAGGYVWHTTHGRREKSKVTHTLVWLTKPEKGGD